MTRSSNLTANPVNEFDSNSLTFAEIGLYDYILKAHNRTVKLSTVFNASSDCESVTSRIVESLIDKNAITVS